MSCKASEMINQMKSWLGKNEKDGSFKVIIDTYNSHKPLARNYKVKYTDAWCMTTISAAAIKCNATDIIPTECSCEKFIELCKQKGIWVENENVVPEMGWIILYDWQDSGAGDNKGWSDHVGIVEKVANGKITVIEGNKAEAVARREILVNAKFIRGYAVPKYLLEPKPTVQKNTIEVDGLWGKDTTKRAQEVFGTPADGIVSNQYLKYKDDNPGLLDATFEWENTPGTNGSSLIKAIQRKVGVTNDGFIGPKTIEAMQRWLGTVQDGCVSKPSTMVKAFQKWLNEQ